MLKQTHLSFLKWVAVYIGGALFSFVTTMRDYPSNEVTMVLAGVACYATGLLFCAHRYGVRDCFLPLTQPKRLLGLGSMLLLLALAVVPASPWYIPFFSAMEFVRGIFSRYINSPVGLYLWNGLAIWCVLVSYATYAWFRILCRWNDGQKYFVNEGSAVKC